MRNRQIRLIFSLALGLLSGCGSQMKPPATPVPLAPLTVAEWRELPVQQKYEESTLDRLKMSDPRLRDDRAWEAFMMETVFPERKQDLPDEFRR